MYNFMLLSTRKEISQAPGPEILYGDNGHNRVEGYSDLDRLGCPIHW